MSHWMQTYTGKPWYFESPRPEDVDIEDIAHALSHLCRFGGHTRRFYSVAEHSVLVSYLTHLSPLHGLMHDATEAYVIDVPKPMKYSLGDAYAKLESAAWRAICVRFGLAEGLPPSVHVADIEALFIEKERLLSPCAYPWMEAEWGMGNSRPTRKRPWVWELGFPPEKAKQKFLERYKELTK